MKASERRALLFTLSTTKRQVEHNITVLKRRIKEDNAKLEQLLQQQSDIDQSISYLESE